MTVQNLIEELNKVINKNLDVVILSKDIDFKTVTDIEETELGYDEHPVTHCIILRS